MKIADAIVVVSSTIITISDNNCQQLMRAPETGERQWNNVHTLVPLKLWLGQIVLLESLLTLLLVIS